MNCIFSNITMLMIMIKEIVVLLLMRFFREQMMSTGNPVKTALLKTVLNCQLSCMSDYLGLMDLKP